MGQQGGILSAEESKQSAWTPTNPLYNPNKPMQIGGQAVIEGVMMRGPGAVATAVRRANGEIVVQRQAFVSLAERLRILGFPILRGAIGLIDMMYLGIKTLNFSAEIAMLDLPPAKGSNGSAKSNGRPRKAKSTASLAGTLAIALTVGVGIFFVVPLYVTTKVFALEQDALSFNLVAGSIRIFLLLVYLLAISLMKDIQRLFRYHGAEHKTVFAFELKDELIPGIVANRSRFHPRCGTSFLLIVMFVAILSFSLLDALLIQVFGKVTLGLRLATHVPFIPVVGGLSYEFIRFSAKHSSTWWGRILVAPGLWLQTITTKEPDSSQLEVAIVALKCALGTEDASNYKFNEAEVPVSVTNPA
jgi:uncharacterized protein YqhQ